MTLITRARISIFTACLWPGVWLSANDDYSYEITLEVVIESAQSEAMVHLTLEQPRDLLREVNFRVDPDRYRDFEGEGILTTSDNRLTWEPPGKGGTISWTVDLSSIRNNGSADGLVTADWAIFRGDDLVPPARTRSIKGAESNTRLSFDLPAGWSALGPYSRSEDGNFLISHPERNFDRPIGWFALGELGVLWDTIAGTRVAVAGPKGNNLRRQDILAFLNWTLPTLKDIFPTIDDRLLIVGAGDPMWRGGLSGPGSLFIYADRPLISENGTSTLLHELVHVATAFHAVGDADWIVEGVAEYYTLQVLKRSGTTTASRYEKSLRRLARWSEDIEDPRTSHSRGKNTARAVIILESVDQTIRRETGGAKSLDDVVRILAAEGQVSNKRFIELAEEASGTEIKVLDPF